jgi:hypothetical protein
LKILTQRAQIWAAESAEEEKVWLLCVLCGEPAVRISAPFAVNSSFFLGCFAQIKVKAAAPKFGHLSEKYLYDNIIQGRKIIMSVYREAQRKKAIDLRDEMFKDPGDGMFAGKKRDFVLSDPVLNLWAGIRYDAMDYFKSNAIAWWQGADDEPTGHLLSSQIACVNHLYALRQRMDLAAAVLKKVDSRIKNAKIVDDGFVEFEINGKKNYLNERSHTRGANSTSVDAVMVGEKEVGKNILVLIEWKYTEEYNGENLYIPERYNIYNPFLLEDKCPLKIDIPEKLYCEPYYQLMRQTLLGWKMVEAGEYNCDEYIHLHIIPENNKELTARKTSPDLNGHDMPDSWKRTLVNPEKYKVISPEELLEPLKHEKDVQSLLKYLEKRYWE